MREPPTGNRGRLETQKSERGLSAHPALWAFHHLLDDGAANAAAHSAHGATDTALRTADPAAHPAHRSLLAAHGPAYRSPDAALGNAFLPADASDRSAHRSLRLPLRPSLLAGHP